MVAGALYAIYVDPFDIFVMSTIFAILSIASLSLVRYSHDTKRRDIEYVKMINEKYSKKYQAEK